MTAIAADAPDTAGPVDTVAEMSTRGRTTLADRVVEKSAAQAALEVDHVHGSAAPLVTRMFGSGPSVSSTANIDGQLAQLSLDIEIDYPAPVRQITRQVRRHVRDRIAALCDLAVTDISVTVTALRTDVTPKPRVQ